MATNAKMGTLENPENSELEVLRAKVRELEETVQTKTEELFRSNLELLAKEAELMSKNEELFAKNQELMSKDEELQTFKKDQIDHNEAQENEVVDILLVFMNNAGFKRIADKILSFLDSESFATFNFEPLIKIMEESRNKSELRVFIKLCREWLSRISLSSHNQFILTLLIYNQMY